MGVNWELFKFQLSALGGLLFLSLSVTWIILYYIRLLDHPNERSSHVLATPKCGGVGIVASFVAGVFVSQLWGRGYNAGYREMYSLVCPLLLIALVSLADDIRELSPFLRLGVQILSAGLFLYMANFLSVEKETGITLMLFQSLFWLGCLLWLVGMANAFNFMDGIDGLAAGQGLIAAFFFGIIQFGLGECYLGFVSFALVVGCLGFLAFNFPPAKVFMGDVGSVSMGFTLATMALLSYQKCPSMEALMVMPLLVSNFIFDTGLTFTCRLIKKESVFEAHRNHLYQRFEKCGFSQRTVTMTNYGLAITQGIIVLLLGYKPITAVLACLTINLLYAGFVIAKTNATHMITV